MHIIPSGYRILSGYDPLFPSHNTTDRYPLWSDTGDPVVRPENQQGDEALAQAFLHGEGTRSDQ